MFEWDDGSTSRWGDRDDLEQGDHWVRIVESDSVFSVRRHHVVKFHIAKQSVCEGLVACGRLRRVEHKAQLLWCLAEEAKYALWLGKSQFGDMKSPMVCSILASLSLATQMSSLESVFLPIDGVTADEGAVFVSLLTVAAIERITMMKKQGGDDDEISLSLSPGYWQRRVASVMALHTRIDPYWQSFVRGEFTSGHLLVEFGMSLLLGVKTVSNQVSVIMYGPMGYNNDPIFAPIMQAAAHEVTKIKNLQQQPLSVMSILPPRFLYASSLVQVGSFPWRLECHIHLTSLYLYHTINSLKPLHGVFPSDGGAVLALSYLKQRMQKQQQQQNNTDTDDDIAQVYPPCPLSKLCSAFRGFTPMQMLLSNDDGYRNIWPMVSHLTLEHLVQSMGSKKMYLKREYSEASSGVSYMDLGLVSPSDTLSSWESVLSVAISNRFPRRTGVEMMDLHMPVRLFLQQAFERGSLQQIGCRFYSHHGRVLSAHSSRISRLRMLPPPKSRPQALSYITLRHSIVENAVETIVARLNYTGFGAAWFVTSPNNISHVALIDFNPRMERHTCFAFANMTHPDPCRAFWLSQHDHHHQQQETFYYPAGVSYQDPSRLVDFEMYDKQPDPDALWNVESRDALVYNYVLKKLNISPNE